MRGGAAQTFSKRARVSELRAILCAYENLCARGEDGVLASVVHAHGSTYRRAGARLLLMPDDTMLGLIGGGCLEGDLLLRAQEVRASGAPLLLRYDASAAGDVLWGLGFGCAGVVEVLLERVGPRAPGPLAALSRWRKTRTRGALATVIAGPRIGAHSTLGEHDTHPSGLRAPHIETALRRVLASQNETGGACISNARADSRAPRALHIERGDERVVIESFAPPLRLLIFGAGPDAAPLAARAHELGWDVEVFDPRAAFAVPARFPDARVHCCETAHAVARAAPGDDAYCVLMTHHYERDRVLLGDALKTRAPYIALLGPRARCEDLLADLQKPAHARAHNKARIFAPVGLDLGAEAPEEIALAIVAEILAVSCGRAGASLRERSGPIHDNPERT